MTTSSSIAILRRSSAVCLWDAVLADVAVESRDRVLDPPLWIVADGRHRIAAEIGLLQELRSKGVSTNHLKTIASLAADILEIPQQTAVASPWIGIAFLTRILKEDTPDSLRKSSAKPNFCRSFWSTLIQVESRGFLPDHPLENPEGPEPSADFSYLQRRLHQQLALRGLFTPGAMLRLAALRLQKKKVKLPYSAPWFIGPLLNVSALDRDFIRQLLLYADRAYLVPGFGVEANELAEVKLNPADAAPKVDFETALRDRKVHFLRPATQESENDFIFSTIADWAADRGYRYSDFRIVHPFLEEMLPRLRGVAQRYRVPIRIHASLPLGQSPPVILTSKLLDFFESRWDRAGMLELLKTRWLCEDPGEKSRLIEEILKKPHSPGDPPWEQWLDLVRKNSAEKIERRLEEWRGWDEQSAGTQTGAAFSQLIEKMTESIAKFWSESTEAIGYAESGIHSSAAADLETIRQITAEISRYETSPLPRAEWIRRLRLGIQVCAGNHPDPPTECVEIISASREDHLPARVLIYPSLTSHVPATERVNPFLNAAVTDRYTRQLRLFQQHLLNARETVILSCPRYGDNGDPLAISPFLMKMKSGSQDSANLIHRVESWKPHHVLKSDFVGRMAVSSPQDPPRIVRGMPARFLQLSAARWSPSTLDQAVQCLFLHFAADLLKIHPLEDEQREAATPAKLGGIAHKALASYLKAVRDGREFDLEARMREEFSKFAARFGAHLELDRAGEELIRCMRDFSEGRWDNLAVGFQPAYFELQFEPKSALPAVQLDTAAGTIELWGRIDRMDVSQDKEVIIVDYKYKKSESENKGVFFREVGGGVQTQLPLYWLAVEKLLDVKPVAMLQIYLRSWKIRGFILKNAPSLWEDEARSLDLKVMDESECREILSAVIKTLEEKSAEIRAGNITPAPRNPDRCGPGKCDYAELCRFRGDKWKRKRNFR